MMNMNNEFVNKTISNALNGDHLAAMIADNLHLTEALDNHIDNLTEVYGPRRDPLYVVIPITIIYMLIFLTGVIGNISTCIVIAKNRSMHTATNYYLFSLAISDFLLLMSGVPQEVYSIWYKYPYVFGEVFCVTRGVLAETSANATVLTITSFTVERYLAICHPFLQHTMSKLSRAVRLILIVWIVSIFLAIPQALQFGVVTDYNGIDHCMVKRIIIEHSFELSTLLFFMTPMTLITVLYILIGVKLRTSGLIKHENGGASIQRQMNVNSCRQQTSIGTRRVLKMLVAVVVAFFLCWAPFHAQRLVAFYIDDQVFIYDIMTYISGILYYLSTCINPLLYNIMSNKFREAFKETLARCCQAQKRNYRPDSTYRVLSRRQRRWNSNQESGDYSGSSVRDDSLYSTSTQRQSFDSVTVSQGQSTKMSTYHGLTNHHHNRDINTKFAFLPTSSKDKINNIITNDMSNRKKNSEDQVRSLGASSSSKETNAKHDKSHEIRIEINCANKRKTQNDSKVLQFLQNIFRWRTNARHIGYYSPRTNQSIDTINIQLNTVVVANDAAMKRLRGPGLVRFQDENLCEEGNDDDSISNSSLKDDSTAAIKDELSTYMEELQLREIR